ncbi:unnamed protein product, partial [Scytosiphon promiscuus]
NVGDAKPSVYSLTRAAGAAQRVFSLMDSLPDIDINSGLLLDDRSFRGQIDIKGVEFTYQMRPDNKASCSERARAGQRRGVPVSCVECACLVTSQACAARAGGDIFLQVLKGLDLHIPGGSTCALVGRSGSGKTTLVHLLLRFYDPQAGRILVDGVPLTDINLRNLHRKTAIVAQDTQLFATSIYENITYGLEEAEYSEEDVYTAARQACAHDFISDF